MTVVCCVTLDRFGTLLILDAQIKTVLIVLLFFGTELKIFIKHSCFRIYRCFFLQQHPYLKHEIPPQVYWFIGFANVELQVIVFAPTIVFVSKLTICPLTPLLKNNL